MATTQITPQQALEVLGKLAESGSGTRKEHEIAILGLPVLRDILVEWQEFKDEQGLHVVDDDEDEDEAEPRVEQFAAGGGRTASSPIARSLQPRQQHHKAKKKKKRR